MVDKIRIANDGSVVYSGWNLDDIGVYGDAILTSKGIPELWLIRHGLTNSVPEEEELLDFDGDGMLNWQEYVSDTNPTNKESVLSLLDVRREGHSARIEWKGGRKARQYVEVCESPASTGLFWRAVYTNAVIPTALTNLCTDSVLTNVPRFYRIRVER